MNNSDINNEIIEKYKIYSLEDILNAREKRVMFKDELIEKFNKPVIMMRVNYPGAQKDNKLTREIIDIMDSVIIHRFPEYVFHKKVYTAEGPLSILVVNEIPSKVKEETVFIEENHILGRCMDIDVYDIKGESISRTELGLSMRKCYICSDIAHNCVRSRKHSEEEVIKFINERYMEHLNHI